jgi:hypothetical protein
MKQIWNINMKIKKNSCWIKEMHQIRNIIWKQEWKHEYLYILTKTISCIIEKQLEVNDRFRYTTRYYDVSHINTSGKCIWWNRYTQIEFSTLKRKKWLIQKVQKMETIKCTWLLEWLVFAPITRTPTNESSWDRMTMIWWGATASSSGLAASITSCSYFSN